MNPSPRPAKARHAKDQDLVDQASPGHGIPSQDPDPAAQQAIGRDEAAREAGSALAGGTLVAGMATGAAIGVAVAGPVGVVVGASLGAVAGAVGGAVAAPPAAPPATSPATSPAKSPARTPMAPVDAAAHAPDLRAQSRPKSPPVRP